MAIENRAGDHADLLAVVFAGDQFGGVGPESRRQQPWRFDPRAAESNDALDGQAACREQLADGDDVLVTDVPDRLVPADGI